MCLNRQEVSVDGHHSQATLELLYPKEVLMKLLCVDEAKRYLDLIII